jgi:uncharacterized membrane protein YcaP (DUF421 family)
MLTINWHDMMIPSVALVELILRGSIMYLVIFGIMRVFRRNQGGLNTADLLVVVMIADAAQNAMSAGYNSLTEGIVLVATIFAWDFLIDWLSYRFAFMHKLLAPRAVPLVVNGRLMTANLRAEMLTRGDLLAQLREHGVSTLDEVRSCALESDGHISVVKR